MKIKSLKLWQWDISGLNINGLNCGCWKAELEVTIDIEPEHEVNEMEYLTEVNETLEWRNCKRDRKTNTDEEDDISNLNTVIEE